MIRPPAIEAPRPRLALPWGDSAYAVCIARRWLAGDPPDGELLWAAGPPDNGLTPSSEGPRRARLIAAARQERFDRSAATLRRVIDRLRALDLDP